MKNKGLNSFLDKKKTTKKQAAANGVETVIQTETVKEGIKETVEKEVKQIASDEEVDDDTYEALNYMGQKKQFKEVKDVVSNKKEDEHKKKNFGYTEVAPVQESKTKQVKRDAGDIKFGGKPMFGRKKTTALAGFEEGIGDIDDDGKLEKTKAKNQGPPIRASAPVPMHVHEEKKEPTRPTFKGRFNAKGSSQAEDGPVKTYDFAVKYKMPFTEEEKKQGESRGENREVKEGETRDSQVIGGKKEGERRNRDKGQQYNPSRPGGVQSVKDQDDEGFKMISSNLRKRGEAGKQRRDLSSEEEETNDQGFNITRGATRGGRGRGGSGPLVE